MKINNVQFIFPARRNLHLSIYNPDNPSHICSKIISYQAFYGFSTLWFFIRAVFIYNPSIVIRDSVDFASF